MKRVILGIDLQYDFCNPQGSLYVNGADEDTVRIARYIEKNIDSIDAIILSMDSHQPIHIAHQLYWRNAEGKHPEVFSTINSVDVQQGAWTAQYNADQAIDYLTKLEEGGDVCTIWPQHCIIGKEGWSLEQKIFGAVEAWSLAKGLSYELINKGMRQSTEHYSIFKAAVEYKDIPETLFNNVLKNRLSMFDEIVVVGEAADFCVANSLNDLLINAPELATKITVLTDCMSYIIKDNPRAGAIFAKADSLGVRFTTSNTQ